MRLQSRNLSGLLLGIVLLSFSLPGQAQRTNPLIYDDPTFEWQDNRDPDSPRPSPNALTGFQLGSYRAMVAYGSPAVKGREIFGGLVPWGQLWRTGANEATTITFTGDVLVEGEPVAAGTYSLYTIPNPTQWKIILNRLNNQWGAYQHDPSQDVLEVEVEPEAAPFSERLVFAFTDVDTETFAATLAMHWDKTSVGIRIQEAD